MLIPHDEEQSLENSAVIRGVKKIFPTTHEFDGDNFFTVKNGKKFITPLFVTLIFVEFSDLVFAVDSIPAIIGITNDPFIVFTSNVFAILGLRSLYFALKGFADIFEHLKIGLAVILMFIGAKMVASPFFHTPIEVTMGVIFGVLLISILSSLYSNRKKLQKQG